MVKSKQWLLDTHVFLWWMQNDKRLGKEIRDQIEGYHWDVWVSVVSVWEIVIKQQRKKIRVPADIEASIAEAGFRVLPVEMAHVLGLRKLLMHHKDPFDRMLVAQTQVERLTLLTADKTLRKYAVKLLWV